MFVFYYAILSEVSPPTALSCFAAAALTKRNPYKTTIYAWKYTLPAFIVPFMFTLDPKGVGILLKGPAMDVIWTTITAFIGLAALAGGVENWFFKKTTLFVSSHHRCERHSGSDVFPLCRFLCPYLRP